MGIFAKGQQFPATVVADTPQNRYGGQLTEDSPAGDAVGETIAEVNATAESANTTAGEIIADIDALEARVDALDARTSISGVGWVAYKRHGGVTLSLNGLEAGFTLPVGWRPPGMVWAPLAVGKSDHNGRFSIDTGGVVTLYAAQPPCYGTITFVVD